MKISVLFFIQGRKVFCWFLLKWCILLMNRMVWCLYCVVCCLVILIVWWIFLILDSIVEMVLKWVFDICVSSCVRVVLLIFGGFQKIIECSVFCFSVLCKGLLWVSRCFCFMYLFRFVGFSCVVRGCVMGLLWNRFMVCVYFWIMLMFGGMLKVNCLVFSVLFIFMLKNRMLVCWLMLLIICMLFILLLWNDRCKVLKRVFLVFGLSMKLIMLLFFLQVMVKFLLIFEMLLESSSVGVWVRC